jgi:hypothetical protein
MLDGPAGFMDYFFGPKFDLSNAEICDEATKVLFLHGALHLYLGIVGWRFC